MVIRPTREGAALRVFRVVVNKPVQTPNTTVVEGLTDDIVKWFGTIFTG